MLLKAATNLRQEENNEDVIRGFGMAVALFKLGMSKHPQVNEMLDNQILRTRNNKLELELDELTHKYEEIKKAQNIKIVNVGETSRESYNITQLTVNDTTIQFATRAPIEVVESVKERVLSKTIEKHGLVFTAQNLETMYINILSSNGFRTKKIV